MKQIRSFILVISSIFLCLPVQAQREVPEGYTVLVADDFNESYLDSDVWTKGLWGANDAHLFPNLNKGGDATGLTTVLPVM